MIYKTSIAIYGKKRDGSQKLETVLSLGEMSMEQARGYVNKILHDNPTKKIITSYEETLLQDPSFSCNQKCLECPLYDDCANPIVPRETNNENE